MKNIIIGMILVLTFCLEANTIQQKNHSEYMDLITEVEKIKQLNIEVLEYNFNRPEKNKSIGEKLYPRCNLLLKIYSSMPDTLYINYTNENNNSKKKNLFSFSEETNFIFLLKTLSLCAFLEKNNQTQVAILTKIKKDLDDMIAMSQNPLESIVPYYGYIIFNKFLFFLKKDNTKYFLSERNLSSILKDYKEKVLNNENPDNIVGIPIKKKKLLKLRYNDMVIQFNEYFSTMSILFQENNKDEWNSFFNNIRIQLTQKNETIGSNSEQNKVKLWALGLVYSFKELIYFKNLLHIKSE